MDDKPAARTAIGRILDREGHEVLLYEDAAPALANVDYSTIDLQIPTSGYDAIGEIR